jgi:DNA-3-methyladenine glycosylase
MWEQGPVLRGYFLLTKSNAPGLRKLQPLPRDFYSAAPDVVARRLLGKIILRESNGEILAGRIVETEAYFGINDPAAHSAAGRTARNAVLFGPPGHAYVYLIYGVHYCLNVSCEPHGQAGCVLIRALDPIAGREAMMYNRGLSLHASGRALTGGPGKLCSALAITRADNGSDMTSRKADLRIVDDICEEAEIAITPRIGITKAADRPLRFHIRGNTCVSR